MCYDEIMFSSFLSAVEMPIVLSGAPMRCRSLRYAVPNTLEPRKTLRPTASDAEREIGAVMEGSRGDFRGRGKPITGINGGMLFQTIVRNVVLHCPVGFEIVGELKRFVVSIQLVLRRLSFLSFFFPLVFSEGMAGRSHEAGVNGDALVDG